MPKTATSKATIKAEPYERSSETAPSPDPTSNCMADEKPKKSKAGGAKGGDRYDYNKAMLTRLVIAVSSPFHYFISGNWADDISHLNLIGNTLEDKSERPNLVSSFFLVCSAYETLN